jgi:glycosyltransferase involved in cell wall biosynthesis
MPPAGQGEVASVKICFLGKYPPIEGGVARDGFWSTCALAEQGIEVHVVTNAEEVEPEFRILDEPWDPTLPPDPRRLAGERLAIHCTASADQPSYIPWATPFVSKLAALATRVIEQHGADLIYSYYLEPYAVAAYLTASWTGVPFGVRHAGSDVGRLMLDPAVRTAYTKILPAADYVFAAESTYRRFLRLGVDLERLYQAPRAALPERYFHPHATPLDVNALLAALAERAPVTAYSEAHRPYCERPFDPTQPTIGIYGKVGEVKGSLDLVRALGRLHRDGCPFNLLALTQGHASRMRAFLQAVAENGLIAHTWVLPFIPHWYVPNFIRACTAVCFLERSFPITMHQPIVPREVIACGTALVLSREIAAKQPYRDVLQHGENVFLADPRDTDELAAVLRQCVEDPVHSREIGCNGFRDLSSSAESFDGYAARLARTFLAVQEGIVATRQDREIATVRQQLRRIADTAAAGSGLVPDGQETKVWQQVDALLASRWEQSRAVQRVVLLRLYYSRLFKLDAAAMERYAAQYGEAGGAESTVAYLLGFGDFLARTLPTDDNISPYGVELARYERALLAAEYCPSPEDTFETINQLTGPEYVPLTPSARPQLSAGVEVASFTYDVVALAEALDLGERPPSCTAGTWHLVFQQVPNKLDARVLRVQWLVRLVLALCDGRRSVEEIARLAERVTGRAPLTTTVVRLLDQLLGLGIVHLQAPTEPV